MLSLLQTLLTRKGLKSLWTGLYLYLECLIFSKFSLSLSACIQPYWACSTDLLHSLPSFCICCFFFLPGTAFPPTSVMLSCNIHHSCKFALICDHHVLVCQPLDKKLYKRRKWFVFAHQHSWVSGCLSITGVCLFNIFSSCMIKGSVPYYRS